MKPKQVYSVGDYKVYEVYRGNNKSVPKKYYGVFKKGAKRASKLTESKLEATKLAREYNGGRARSGGQKRKGKKGSSKKGSGKKSKSG
jgi:hypothetical protein